MVSESGKNAPAHEPARSSPSGRSIPSLDGVRCLAILMVIVHHSFSLSAQKRLPVLYSILGNGSLGVSIFFVLSGYLITLILLREQETHGTINFGQFYRRRVVRLLPALYVYIAVIAVLSFTGWVGVDRRNLVYAALGIYNYASTKFGTQEIAHSWSLSAEWQFYLLWPLLLVRAKNPKRIALAIILAEPLIRLLTQMTPGKGRMGMMLHTQADLLLWGCLLAMYWKSAELKAIEQRLFRPWILASAALFLFVVSPVLGYFGGGPYNVLIGPATTGPLVALLLCWVVRQPSTAVGKVLNHPLAMRIGLISYSVYLWQQLFIWEAGGLPLIEFVARYLLLLAVSITSYFLFERLRSSSSRRMVAQTVAANA